MKVLERYSETIPLSSQILLLHPEKKAISGGFPFPRFAQGYFGKRHKKALGKAWKSGAEGINMKIVS